MSQTSMAGAPAESGLRNAVHVLTSVLLIVVVSSSIGMPFASAGINIALAALFGFGYFFGASNMDDWPKPAQWIWVTFLTVVWLLMLPVSTIGIYLILSLYFLYLWVLPDWRGIVAVVASTAAAILIQIPGGLTVGGVMGPAVSALVVVAIAVAFRTLTRISAEREVLIKELMDTRSQLAESEHQAGIVAERQRIAHEIHDTVAQGLSSIQMLLHAAKRDLTSTTIENVDTDAVIDWIEKARSAAAENLAEARAMISALQPAGLSDASLAGALTRVAEGFGSGAGIDIEVVVDGEEQALPMTVEAALLRIAQGALGNMAKHSHASRGRVTLSFVPDEVRLDVYDNGRGFVESGDDEQAAGLGHIGLSAMRRRAEEIGGSLEIESTLGAGTAVSVIVPLKG